MAIRESLLNTINSIATSDFVRAVTSAGASSKVTVSNLAKAIVENYTGSTLAGSAQSVKSAIDAIQQAVNGKANSWTFCADVSPDQTATVPDSAVEVLVMIYDSGGQYSFFASGTARVASITGRAIWDVGGYYYSSSDYGLYNLNVSNSGRSFAIRNVRRVGSDIKSSCRLTVYYR